MEIEIKLSSGKVIQLTKNEYDELIGLHNPIVVNNPQPIHIWYPPQIPTYINNWEPLPAPTCNPLTITC